MSTSPVERLPAVAQSAFVTADSLGVELIDGRTISVPLEWYPRLAIATTAEREHWVLIGRGEGIHWPNLDEDISVANLLAGSRSGESQRLSGESGVIAFEAGDVYIAVLFRDGDTSIYD